jgi:hypothetical protein
MRWSVGHDAARPVAESRQLGGAPRWSRVKPLQNISRGIGYRRISTMSEAIEALAEAWASLDGKLDEFLAGRGGEDTEGDYHGYLSDAAELAKRLEHRGYLIVHAPRDT